MFLDFSFKRSSGHERVVSGAGAHDYGENLVPNAADDLLSIALGLGVRSNM